MYRLWWYVCDYLVEDQHQSTPHAAKSSTTTDYCNGGPGVAYPLILYYLWLYPQFVLPSNGKKGRFWVVEPLEE